MIEILNSIADKWFSFQWAMLWQVAVLIAVVWISDLAIRRWVWPQVRYALWLLVIIKLVIPPTLTSPVSVTSQIPETAEKMVRVQFRPVPEAAAERAAENISILPETNRATSASNKQQTAEEAGVMNNGTAGRISVGGRKPDAEFPAAITPAPSVPAQPEVPKPKLSVQTYAMLAWGLGAMVLAVWLAARLRALRKQHSVCHAGLDQASRRHRPGPRLGGRGDSSQFDALLKSAAQRLKLRRLPEVIFTERVSCPAVFGVFRPVLLMPAQSGTGVSPVNHGRDGHATITERDMEHILLHELAHIKRGDLLVHALYMVLQIAYWFNPLLWLIRKTLQNLRELCCDATVARLLKEDTVHYRQTLLETARGLLAQPVEPGLGLLGLFENSNWLVTRLQWLEKKTWKNRPLCIATIITLVSLMTLCVLPMANRSPFEVTGTVTDAETGEPIAGAEVYDDGYDDNKARATTDANGRFVLKTANEEHNISVKADGYQPQLRTLTTWPFANHENFDFALTSNSDPFQKESKELKANNFIATLPLGGTIRLAGVRKLSESGKPWYSPDGSRQVEAKVSSSEYSPQPGGKGYEFNVVLETPSNKEIKTARTRWYFEPKPLFVYGFGQYWSGGVDDLRHAVQFADDVDTVDITLEISNGPWDTVAVNSPSGGLIAYIDDDQAVEIKDIREESGSVAFKLLHPLRDIAHRVVAVLKDGRTRLPAEYREMEYGDVDVRFDGLKLADVNRFEFQTQETDVVYFKNISLKTGLVTNPTYTAYPNRILRPGGETDQVAHHAFALYRVLGHENAPSFGETRKSDRFDITGLEDDSLDGVIPDDRRLIIFATSGPDRFDAMRPENYPLDGLILDEEPLLTDEDIVFYDWQKQQIHLKPGVAERLPQVYKPPMVFGVPFVVVADGQRIYLGAFWTGLSSYMSNLPTITLEPWGHEPPLPDDVIQISMGGVLKDGQQPTYPNRNSRIRDALDSVGLLLDNGKTQSLEEEKNLSLRPGRETEVEVSIDEGRLTKNEQTRAASVSDPIKANPEFTAALPNGVTIELLGVCEYPSEGKLFWSPDGKIALKDFEIKYHKTDHPQRVLGFIFRTNISSEITHYDIQDLADHLGTAQLIDTDGEFIKAYKNLREHIILVAMQNSDSTNVTCLVAAAWENPLLYDGKYLIGMHDPKITIFETYETSEGLNIVFANDHPEYENKFQAVLTYDSAQRLWQEVQTGSRDKYRIDANFKDIISPQGQKRILAFFEQLKLSDVKQFELFTRPKAEKVTFKNVALRPDVEAEGEIEAIQAKIQEIESQCTPSEGTSREEVEKRFGEGKPTVNSKIPVDAPPDSRLRAYTFCENGTLLVCYDNETNSIVSWAHYVDPYSVKGRLAGSVPTTQELLNELMPRLKQMEAILAEYQKRFGNDRSRIMPDDLIWSGIPEGWGREELWNRLVAYLKQNAVDDLPGCEITMSDLSNGSDAVIKDGQLHISYHPQDYRVERPTSKSGRETDLITETGPQPDGLIVRVWLSDEIGQLVRPQTIDRTYWKLYAAQLYLPELNEYLYANIEYGDQTNEIVLSKYMNLRQWLDDAAINTDSLRQAVASAERLKEFAVGCILYAADHGDVLAPDVSAMKPYLRPDHYTWVEENVVYLGKGSMKEIKQPANAILAYDKQMLNRAVGVQAKTNVVFADGHVETMVTSEQLEKELGILLRPRNSDWFEGALEFDKDIPVDLVVGTGEQADIVKVNTIRFKRQGEQILQKIDGTLRPWPHTDWRFRIELLDEQGKVVGSLRYNLHNRGRSETDMTNEFEPIISDFAPIGPHGLITTNKPARFTFSIEQKQLETESVTRTHTISGTVVDATEDWPEEFFDKLDALQKGDDAAQQELIKEMQPAPVPLANVTVTLEGKSVSKQAVTDADGRFEFGDLKGPTFGPYGGMADCEVYEISAKVSDSMLTQQVTLDSDKTVALRLRRDLVTIKGLVTDEGGKAIAGAKVTATLGMNDISYEQYLETHEPQQWHAVTGQDGTYELTGIEPANWHSVGGLLYSGNPHKYVDIAVDADGFAQSEPIRVPLVTEKTLQQGRRFLAFAKRMAPEELSKTPQQEPGLPTVQGNTISGVDIVLTKADQPSAEITAEPIAEKTASNITATAAL